ncbi:hypothetical protein [Cetobacterium sp.]|uniref:hypothetical protein n=1 Tax=Cetobacterium sp. TaxID=2071632 RepID=UPI002FC71679
MKKFLMYFFDGLRLMTGVSALLLVIVATLKKEDIEIVIPFIIIMMVCFFKNKIFTYILNKDKELKLKNNLLRESIKVKEKEQMNRQELDRYEGTGEIFKFKYLENENISTEKEVIVEYIYTFNKELCIKAYNLNLQVHENFKLNRILL